MYPIETHNRFVELRAKGWPLARIAAELQIAKGTAVEWERQHRAQIADLRNLEIEALQDRILASHEAELAALAGQLQRVEDILAKRKFECLSTEYLFCMAGALRSQIRRLRVNPTFSLPKTEPSSPAP